VSAPIVEQLALSRLGEGRVEDPPERPAGGPAAAGGELPVAARFEGRTPNPEGHVFGGLVVGQALRAAQATVDDVERVPHSLHASFLRSGRAAEPIRYTVERTRDGGAFSTRRVVAWQQGEPILVLTAGFHPGEPGMEYQVPASLEGVPGPDELGAGRYDGPAFDCRDVPVGDGPASPRHARRMWFRARGRVPDDPDLHRWALAYASDHGPTRAVREPHADHPGVEQRHSVSLDHSVWFHRWARVDEWLFSELWPMSTGASRGLCVGTIHTAGGVLVATVAQEALLRLPGT
jgi:acyl-CoA thioesterase-2